MWVCIPVWEECKNTHQHNSLLVDCDRCCNGTLVDVFCHIYSFRANFLFKSFATPCLLSNFPSPMYMCPWRDSHISALFGLHVSQSRRASHLPSSTSRIYSSVLSLEFNDLAFFCGTTKVTSFSSSVSRCDFFSGAAFAWVFGVLTFTFISCFFFSAGSFICLSAAALHLLCLLDHFFFASYTQRNVSVHLFESLSTSGFSLGLFVRRLIPMIRLVTIHATSFFDNH